MIDKHLALRVGSANIQNLPDMPDFEVRSDVKKASDYADLLLWQEIGEKADLKAIIETLGSDTWGTSGTGKETVVSWKRDRFTAVGKSSSTLLSAGLGPGKNSPPRWLTKVVLDTGIEGAPLIEAHSIHYIQGAWVRKNVPEKGLRKQLWTAAWMKHREHVLRARELGRIVVFGGDWNRSGHDVAPFHESQRRLTPVGRGGIKNVDHVYVVVPQGVSVLGVPVTTRRSLYSDHDFVGGVVQLGFKVPEPVRPPSVERAVAAMADARAYLRGVPSNVNEPWPGRVKQAMTELQAAINTLYGK